MTLQTLTRLSRCSQTLSISLFGSNPHFLSSFFHLKYSLHPALSVIPFCKTENHLLSSVSLYLKKKKIIMLNISAHSIFSSHLARLSLPQMSSILCSLFFILKQKFLNAWTSFECVRVYVWFAFTEKRKKMTYFWKLAFTDLPDPPL